MYVYVQHLTQQDQYSHESLGASLISIVRAIIFPIESVYKMNTNILRGLYNLWVALAKYALLCRLPFIYAF